MKNLFNKGIREDQKGYKCKTCNDFGEVYNMVTRTFSPCPSCSTKSSNSPDITTPPILIPDNCQNNASICEIPICDESDTKQIKVDTDTKFPINYILVDMAEQVHKLGEVMEFGKKKYPNRYGWREVDLESYKDAMTRHLHKFLIGEINDEESGIHHLAHLAVNCLMAMYVMYRQDKKDG